MLRVWVGFIALIGLVIGCDKAGSSGSLVVDDSVWIRVIPKVEAAMERPSVDGALDTVMNGVVEDPKLLIAGTTLLTQLSADEKISGPLEDLITRITQDKNIQAEVMRLMAEHPEATPDQVGELVGQRFEQVWSTKPVSDAWMASFNLYLSKMRGGPEGQRVRALFDGIRAPVVDSSRLAKWSKRLETLEGKALTGREAQDAYIRHAWSDARIDKFAIAVSKNKALHRITAQALADMLSLPSLRGDLQTTSVALLSDAQIRENVLTALILFSLKDPPIDKVRVALNELMTTPALIQVSGKLVGRVLDNKDVRGIVDRWYEACRSDASIRAAFVEFLDNW
jgi:hypothetical protein